MVDKLLLISGNDIPLLQGRLVIHQPRLKEIAYITEKKFWIGYETLKFDKNNLSRKEYGQDLDKLSNFQLILSLLARQEVEVQQIKINIFSLLGILFPTSTILVKEDCIQLQNTKNKEVGFINNDNFEKFKEILKDMFCLGNDDTNKQYNPSGHLAQKIAQQMREARKKRAQLGSSKDEDVSFFNRYISILATAKNKSINEIMDYTIYQLMNEFNRYMLYKQNEQWFAMKIAGASGMKEPQDWLKDIY